MRLVYLVSLYLVVTSWVFALCSLASVIVCLCGLLVTSVLDWNGKTL